MKLSKKHIGQLFDVRGSDGSWIYQLLDVKGKKLLFYCFGAGRYYVEPTSFTDWRPFEPQNFLSPERVEQEWKNAKVAK